MLLWWWWLWKSSFGWERRRTVEVYLASYSKVFFFFLLRSFHFRLGSADWHDGWHFSHLAMPCKALTISAFLSNCLPTFFIAVDGCLVLLLLLLWSYFLCIAHVVVLVNSKVPPLCVFIHSFQDIINNTKTEKHY
jgi:hypothetical protein